MLTVTTRKMSIYVDRVSKQWIVLDPEGNFWILPAVDNAWNHREPFFPTEKTDLEPVPGHYKSMLGLPP